MSRTAPAFKNTENQAREATNTGSPSSSPRRLQHYMRAGRTLVLGCLAALGTPEATAGPKPGPRSALVDVTETYIEHVTVNFKDYPAGLNPEGTIIQHPDAGRLRVVTSNAQGFIMENGTVRSGPTGQDHVIMQLLDGQRFIETVDVVKLCGSGGGNGKLNVSNETNHYRDLGTGGTFVINHLGDAISVVVPSGSGFSLVSFTIGVERTRVVATPPPPTPEVKPGEVTVNFAAFGNRNNPEMATIQDLNIGTVAVVTSNNQGFIMENGSIRSREDGRDHIITLLRDGPQMISSVTVTRLNGGTTGGKLGIGTNAAPVYFDLNGGGTIPIGIESDSISLIVPSGAGYALNYITAKVKYPINAANLVASNFSALGTSVAQGTRGTLGQFGNVKFENAGTVPLKVVNGGLQAGEDGAGHIMMTFLDGYKFITTVNVAHLGGAGDGRLCITTAEGKTEYIPLNQGGIIRLNRMVRSIGIVTASGGGKYRLNEMNHDISRNVEDLYKPSWGSVDNPYQTAVNTNSSIAFEKAGENFVGTLNVYKANPNPNGYSRFDVHTLSGSARITQIGYLHSQGFSAIPSDYAKLLGDKSAMIYPGGPQHLVLTIEANGQYEVLTVSGTNEESSVDVPEALTPKTDFVGFYTQPVETQGFDTADHTPHNASPMRVLIGTGRLVTKVENVGLQAGSITAQVHVGYAGTTSDPVAGSYSTSLASMESKILNMNITAPDAGVEEGTIRKPVLVTVVLTMPDGSMRQDVYALNRQAMHSMDTRIATGNPQNPYAYQPTEMTDSEKERFNRIQRRIATAVNGGRSITLTWTNTQGERQTMYVDARNAGSALQDIQGTIDTPLQITDISLQAAADSNLHLEAGGISAIRTPSELVQAREAVKALEPRGVYAELVSLYQDSNPTSPIKVGDYYIRKDTDVGRIFMGMYQNLISMADDRQNLARHVAKLESVTGISGQTVFDLAIRKDYIRFQDGLEFYFRLAGYSSAFDDEPTLQYNPAKVLKAVHLDSSPYRNGNIRLRWNTITAGKVPLKTDIYLIDANGNKFFEDPLMPNVVGKSHAEIPVSSIGLSGLRGFRLRAEVLISDNPTEKASADSDAIGIDYDGSPEVSLQHLTTLPAGHPDVEKENAILSVLANPQSFPIREPAINTWSWNIASPYHRGFSFNAVDISLSGTADQGKAVKIPLKGVVERNGTDSYHTVILRHTTTIAGKEHTWYSKYLHMENVGTYNADGSVTPLQVGSTIERNTQIGRVGDAGAPGSFHFHFEAMGDLTDGYNGHSIDLRRLLTLPQALGITKISAEDAGLDGSQENYADNKSFPIHWDETERSFVTSEKNGVNPNLILDRSAQQGLENTAATKNQYWIARHPDISKRARVVYDNFTASWYMWDSEQNKFFENSQGAKRKWISSSQKWSDE